MRYEEALMNREREARRAAVAFAEGREVTREVTREEKAELFEAADALEALGFSPVVFLRRAVDAQDRLAIAKEADAVRPKDKEALEAIKRHLREPDSGPDVLYSPGLLHLLQGLRYGAVPRFSSGPPVQFTDAEFDLVSLTAGHARGTEKFLDEIVPAIALHPRTKKTRNAKTNADVFRWRVYRVVSTALESALKGAGAVRDAAGIERELAAREVPEDLRPRLRSLALKSRAKLTGDPTLRELLAVWLADLVKGRGQAAALEPSADPGAALKDLERLEKWARSLRRNLPQGKVG
jgi:hypothetical protein